MARRPRPQKPSTPRPPQTPAPDLREGILADFAALRVPLTAAHLDAALTQADQEGLSHLTFLHRVIADQAHLRRERRTQQPIKDAHVRELKTRASFDWNFNAKAINRVQVEDRATGDFIRRRQNLVLVGQSGLGKTFLVQAIGLSACTRGYRVRYLTSAKWLRDLTASLADQTWPKRVGYYAHFEALIIDAFGFERIERLESPPAASLFYKILEARSQKGSTVLVTNIDFEAWGDYLGDPPLARAFLDRVVDGAIILKIQGKSDRAHRAGGPETEIPPE